MKAIAVCDGSARSTAVFYVNGCGNLELRISGREQSSGCCLSKSEALELADYIRENVACVAADAFERYRPETDLRETHLSTRSRLGLSRAGNIKTVGDLLKVEDVNAFLRIDGIGYKSVREIRDFREEMRRMTESAGN